MQTNRRLGNRKVTTGCRTCKGRKVKCDEAKPHCARCTKSGRLCSGYDNALQAISQNVTQDVLHLSGSQAQGNKISSRAWSSPKASLLGLGILTGTDEKGLFQYFRIHAPNSMAGILDAKFWTIVVPQVCFTWASVRCGVMALSALIHHRNAQSPQVIDVATGQRGSSLLSRHPDFVQDGVKLYSRALSTTVHDLLQNGNRDVAALTCILFFCIECVQGNRANAFSMLHHGQNLLDSAKDSSSQSYYHHAALASAVERMFARIRLATSLSGNAMAGLSTALLELKCYPGKDAYKDICEARRALFEIMTGAHELHLVTRFQGCESNHTTTRARSNLVDAMEVWKGRSAPYLSAALCEPHSYEHQASLILKCHYSLCEIWLACALDPSELAYDKHYQKFEIIVNWASEIVRIKSWARVALPRQHGCSSVAESEPQPYSSSPFQLETGVLLPLYYTACKCRCPQLRRQAVYWLRHGPSQEGFLERDQLIRVALRLIELETQIQNNDLGIWPAEAERVVHHAIETPSADAERVGWLRECRVKFFMSPESGKPMQWDELLIY